MEENLTLKELEHLHGILVGEILKADTQNGTMSIKVLNHQLQTVTNRIRKLQKAGSRPTLSEWFKSVLNRLKIIYKTYIYKRETKNQ